MDKPEPTEDQVKAANEAEEARWQGDFDEDNLKIPYKRETENGTNKKTEGDKGAGDDKTDDEDKTPPAEEELDEPEPVVTTTDPGEYVPADYSFDVTLKDGKTVKISTPEEAEKLAEDPDNFETPKQLMDFINKQNKMNQKLDKDYEKWEQQHETFTKQVETETQRREQVTNFENEFNYLAGKGLIPKLSAELQAADWADPEIAKNEDVKVYNAILGYFIKENKERAKAKVAPMTSMIEAYNAMQADPAVKKADEDKQVAGQARKDAGARVAGVSPTQQTGYVPKGIAVGNPNILKRGSSIWDD